MNALPLNALLPTLLTFGLFCVIVGVVLKSLLRPLSKVAVIVCVLVLLGVLPVPMVQQGVVALVTFLFKTLQVAWAAVAPAAAAAGA